MSGICDVIERAEVLGNGAKRMVDVVAAYDVETTTVDIDGTPQAIVYSHQIALNDTYQQLRTWDGILALFAEMEDVLSVKQARMRIWVHNLSFEFQFLKSAIKIDEVLAVDKRTVLMARSGHLVFCCSAVHSGTSLARFIHDYAPNSPWQKQSGERFNYSKKRYPDTRLTAREKLYCECDVRGLVDALRGEMAVTGDTINTLPLTSTGFARRDVRRAMAPLMPKLRAMQPDLHLYRLLREAFRGGNTHASRFEAGEILHGVECVDESSAYIAALCCYKYPISSFWKVENADISRCDDLSARGYSVLMRLHLENVQLRRESWPVPYIAAAKTRNLVGAALDNGRVLSADRLDLTVINVDYEILVKEYYFKATVVEAWAAWSGMLPKELRDVLLEYYRRKTRLKGVDEVAYNHAKRLLNAIYGMAAQDPCAEEIYLDAATLLLECDEKPVAELLKEGTRRPYMCYQWAVWCTARARWMLEQGIDLCEKNGFLVYTDTDSCKYQTRDGAEVDFTALNDERRELARRYGGVAVDRKGVEHFLGVFEREERCTSFITYGAKKYAYISGGRLHVTTAGVSKKHGARELRAIKNYRPGFVFKKSGGMRAIYNDEWVQPKKMMIDGHEVLLTTNTVLLPSEYTLGVTVDYSALINRCKNRPHRVSEVAKSIFARLGLLTDEELYNDDM